MKILHAVLSEGFYGSERYCAELAASQARDGHDVEIIVHGAWSDLAADGATLTDLVIPRA